MDDPISAFITRKFHCETRFAKDCAIPEMHLQCIYSVFIYKTGYPNQLLYVRDWKFSQQYSRSVQNYFDLSSYVIMLFRLCEL